MKEIMVLLAKKGHLEVQDSSVGSDNPDNKESLALTQPIAPVQQEVLHLLEF